MGFISHHEIEWGLIGNRMRAVIVSEFCVRNVIGPRYGVISAKDLKISFDFLVYSFSLSIGLGMVGSGKGKIVFQKFPKLISEGGGELSALIGDDLVVEAKVEVYFVEKDGGYSFSSDSFLSRAENHPLSKFMVDHDQE